jgi:hypothetical protein
MIICGGGKLKKLREKPAPVPFHTPGMSHGVTQMKPRFCNEKPASVHKIHK